MFSDADTPLGIVVLPLDGCGVFIVLADEGHDPASEIRYGSEDATVDEVALDLGEPEFDLNVEPDGTREPSTGVPETCALLVNRRIRNRMSGGVGGL